MQEGGHEFDFVDGWIKQNGTIVLEYRCLVCDGVAYLRPNRLPMAVNVAKYCRWVGGEERCEATGKLQYQGAAQARAARVSHEKRYKVKMHGYLCPFCDKWHIAHWKRRIEA